MVKSSAQTRDPKGRTPRCNLLTLRKARGDNKCIVKGHFTRGNEWTEGLM